MYTSWRAVGLGLAASALLVSTGCSAGSPSSAESARTPLASMPPGEYGTALDPSQPDPTDVATDAPPPEAPPSAATVLISYYGWSEPSQAVEVGGFAASVAESGGTCTLTLTKGASAVTTTATAVADVRTSACGQMSVPSDRLTPGAWTVSLAYDSATSHGVSSAVEVQVP
jgi:hypothetical protein